MSPSIDELLAGLHATFTVAELDDEPGRVYVNVHVDCEDWEPFGAWDLYEWVVRVSVRLTNGEVRRRWLLGSHNQADLYDNHPHAQLVLPKSFLPETPTFHVEGWLHLWFGPEEAKELRFDWAHDFHSEATITLPRVAAAPDPPIGSFDGTVHDCPAEAISLPVRASGRLVACLPEVGLIERCDDQSYTLHTPDGALPMPAIAEQIAALPGKPFNHDYPFRHWGGPRGRLAILVNRQVGYNDSSMAITERHLLLFALPEGRVIAHLPGVGQHLGFFDRAGTAFVCEQQDQLIIDADSGQIRATWPSGSLLLQEERWHIERDELWVVKDDRLRHLAPGSEPAEEELPPYVEEYNASAFHPEPGVAAWSISQIGKVGHGFPAPSLLCFDPRAGCRQHALPDGGTLAIAVLRDGRVLVCTDRLLLIHPDDGIVHDLGPVAKVAEFGLDTGAALQLSDDERYLWTLDPQRWRISIPRSADRQRAAHSGDRGKKR